MDASPQAQIRETQLGTKGRMNAPANAIHGLQISTAMQSCIPPGPDHMTEGSQPITGLSL